MTNHTFETFILVLNKRFVGHRYGFVTSLAGHFGMFPVEFKPRFVVVKFFDFPTFRSGVALGTIRYSIDFKLLFVHIFMAGSTIRM